VARPRLNISRDVDYDYLSALEFGRVVDGQIGDAWRVLEDQVGLLYERERCLGLHVNDFSDLDPEADGFEELWTGPRFDVPQLGLVKASAGEVCVAAKAQYADEPTLNRRYFDFAVAAGSEDRHEDAAELWRERAWRRVT